MSANHALQQSLQCVADARFPGVAIAIRRIASSDDAWLTPEEAAELSRAIPKVRCASGAAREAARSLLRQFGLDECSLLPRQGRGPTWPHDVCGSLAHDDELAAASICLRSHWRSIGIDVEPALPLPRDVLDVVVLPAERQQVGGDLVTARLVFCVKEAVYKATHPVDGIFLEPSDVEVDLLAGRATTRTGRVLRIGTLRSSSLLALAAIPPDDQWQIKL